MRKNIIAVLFFLLSLFPLFLASLSISVRSGSRKVFQQPEGCPERCECDDNLSSTVCSRRNLTAIPQVPVTSLYFYFDRNVFDNPHLTADNLSSIPYVRGLYLKGCGIRSFLSSTFSSLKFLRELDLSYNKIRLIPRAAFVNLQLDFLDLGHNPGLRLVPDSFCGAFISKLSFKCCDFTHVDIQTFHPLFDSLTSLTLSCNDLTTMPAPLVWSPRHLTTLNLADNPRLTCDCNMFWISRRKAFQKESFKVDFKFPQGCEVDSSLVIPGGPSQSSNCSTDSVMLKNIDYGLCVRSLEALRLMETALSTKKQSTLRTKRPKGGKNNKKRRDRKKKKSNKNKTTATATTSEADSNNGVIQLEGFFTTLSTPPEGTATTAPTTTLAVPPCSINNETTVIVGDSGQASNPMTQYTRAHVFIACIAAGIFTFFAVVFCYCANRLCARWLGDHRRRMESKLCEGSRANDKARCNLCSSTNAHQQTTASAVVPTTTLAAVASSSGYNNASCSHRGAALRQNYSTSDDLKSTSSLCSQQSSPLGGNFATKVNTATNRQTLHVRIAEVD